MSEVIDIHPLIEQLRKTDIAVGYQRALNDVTTALNEMQAMPSLSLTERLLLNVVQERIARLRP